MREVHAQHYLVDADLAPRPYLGEREDRGTQVTLAREVLRGLHPDEVTDVLPGPAPVQDVVHRSQLRDHPIRAHLGEYDLEVRVALKDSAPDEMAQHLVREEEVQGYVHARGHSRVRHPGEHGSPPCDR